MPTTKSVDARAKSAIVTMVKVRAYKDYVDTIVGWMRFPEFMRKGSAAERVGQVAVWSLAAAAIDTSFRTLGLDDPIVRRVGFNTKGKSFKPLGDWWTIQVPDNTSDRTTGRLREIATLVPEVVNDADAAIRLSGRTTEPKRAHDYAAPSLYPIPSANAGEFWLPDGVITDLAATKNRQVFIGSLFMQPAKSQA